MTKAEVYQSYNEFIVPSYTKTPAIFVKGKGSYLWDIDGKKYLDFFPGWGVGNIGHCHTKVMTAVRDQVAKLIFIPNNYYNIPQAKLAKELNFWAAKPYKAFFGNSGAEANEAAIKLSRKFGKGRHEIITFLDSFHGRTLAALSATGQKKYQEGFEPLVQDFKSVAFNDLDAVKQAISDKTVAIMLELVQGEGGINIATPEFVKGLRELCDKNKSLLILDEVQTGIGRTGTMFAWQQYDIEPDIFTLAKSLGGGLPIGVMMAKPELAGLLTPGTHASTFGGGPVVCRGALAVLQAVQKEGMLSNAKKMGAFLKEQLIELKGKHPIIKDVRSMGLMIGVELSVPGKPIVEACMNKSLLINCTHDKVLRIMPALNVTKAQITKAIAILDSALAQNQAGQ
ncbi:MAG: aspartate aminotransferase family protein [Candidatus Omnitrophica bacterium]|jgi:acetylornithine/N-succinyldiaminopimelate aminotransferase|nr:aspartate aminotransferase family protein [Candidatus Omnitrophota bacterium]